MRSIGLAMILLCLSTHTARAQMLTFDEPQSNQAMTNVFNGLHTLYFSPTAPDWSFGDVSLNAVGSTLYLRSTFDDRSPSPYPYRFIARNVAQIQASQLRIDFPNGTSRFGFGAALDSTSGQGQMTVDISGAGGSFLGSYSVSLQRSTNTDGSTNSEGVFFVSGVGDIRSVTISNLGDALVPASRNNWVIDNIQYAVAGQVGPQGPAGSQGPKGDTGAPASFPAGMLLYLIQGSPVPGGFTFIGRLGIVDVYLKL
jgi:hypothetical protein